ncbi:MAG TPA: iron ABC transporter permease [Candidatus Methylomirabilis sp.]|jgi:iron(III) transport system permease protein|nr:iron ABC transporter permease [Candidatus Methylomirabilis sp.]
MTLALALRGRSRPLLAPAVGAPVAVLILGPLLFLAWMGARQGAGEFFLRVEPLGLPAVIGRTFLLAVGTTAFALALAVPLAYLVARSDLPGRHLLRWLAPLPLTIPPYIGALVYQLLLAPGGPLDLTVAGLLGLPAQQVGVIPIYGLAGAGWVLGLFTFPYIYLLVEAALERVNPALVEAARGAGLSPWQAFRRITLPLLRPALLAGSLMVFLYVWADFGVVSLLRVRTLTTIIYDYVQGTLDWGVPAGLSLILTGITLLVLALQRRLLGRAGYVQIGSAARPPRPVPLGRARLPALFFVVLVLAASFLLPITVLAIQAARMRPAALGTFLWGQAPYFLNSLWTASGGATAALLLALAIAWLQERRGTAFGLSTLCQVGYAIPGTVLGLGMVGFFSGMLPWLYATAAVVVAGYLVLFLTPALQAVKAALAQLPVSLEEAARTLGRGSMATFREVTLPLIRPGLLGGWLLTFILCMRELAATLILRPPGFDTLPVRVWIHTMDVGPEPGAAALALALVASIALPWLGVVLAGRRLIALP